MSYNTLFLRGDEMDWDKLRNIVTEHGKVGLILRNGKQDWMSPDEEQQWIDNPDPTIFILKRCFPVDLTEVESGTIHIPQGE